MCSKFGWIRPQTTELAALERQKKSQKTYNGENGAIVISRLFLIGSFSYLQETRKYRASKIQCLQVFSVDIDPILHASYIV